MKKSLALTAAALVLAAGVSLIACKNTASGDDRAAPKPMPNIGDVVLKDGRFISPDKITQDNKGDAMAIVYWKDEKTGRYLGMGLDVSGTMKWAETRADGIAKFFDTKYLEGKADFAALEKWTSILAIKDNDPTSHPRVDANLYDSWVKYGEEKDAIIDKILAEGGSTNEQKGDFTDATKCIALNHARSYGETKNFPGTWFLPTPLSLVEIGVNRAIINDTLKKLDKPSLGGETDNGGDGTTTKYWSSVTRTGNGNRQYALILTLHDDRNKASSIIDQLKYLTIDENQLVTYSKKDGTTRGEAKVISVRAFQN